MAKLENTVLTRTKFINCKLLGIDFSVCSSFAFSVSFEDCIMDYTHFHRNNLKKSSFINCTIKEAGFFDLDLSKADFSNSNLRDTVFERGNLSGADFTSATNFIVNPLESNVKKAKFSYPGILGLLQNFDIIIED
jgi:uncharacterized protein YjbI with pentapeptide repeats